MRLQTILKKISLHKTMPVFIVLLGLATVLAIWLFRPEKETTPTSSAATAATPLVTTTSQPTPSTRPDPTATPSPDPTLTPTPLALNVYEMNLLTGQRLAQPVAIQVKPVAIMVNNIRKSLPQTGIAAADLIIEMEVESGITRLLAVYTGTAAVPAEVGSLRSARHNFVDLACGFDALLVHVGGSSYALNQIKDQQLVTIDMLQVSSPFWRDQDWINERGYTHSVKTSGERLQQVIVSRALDVTAADPAPVFSFNWPELFVPADGPPATIVQAPFSRSTIATFHYETDTRTYSKQQSGQPHLDLSTGQAIRFTNVLLLQTASRIISDRGHIEADLSAGRGYYLSGGHAEEITWSKGDTFAPLQLFAAGGHVLHVNVGKSYIGILSDKQEIAFSD